MDKYVAKSKPKIKLKINKKVFPILYQITNSNKVYQWIISVITKPDKSVWMVTEYGQKDGKIRHIEKEIKSGKRKGSIAETTKFEQAVLESESKWKYKQEKDGYMMNLDATLDTKTAKKPHIIKPMLADTFTFDSLDKKRGKHIILPAYSQPKLDGLRCISFRDKKINKIILTSRKGLHFSFYDHIRNELDKVFNNNILKDRDLYLDGELYTDKLSFQTLSGLIRTKKLPNKKDKLNEFLTNMKLMEYHIYDLFDLNDMTMTYKTRYQLISQLLDKKGFKHLKMVETDIVNTAQDIKDNMTKYLNMGYEGLMLRNINSVYQFKRTKDLQKYKYFIDDEFEIIGYEEATGTHVGTVKWICKTKDDKKFKVYPEGTLEYRTKLLKNADKYIGKMLTVKYFEYTDEGVPRMGIGKAIRDPEY